MKFKSNETLKLKNLVPKFIKQKSFYGKAKIVQQGNILYLYSYETLVAEVDIKTGDYKIQGWYSQTSTKHISEFLRQYANVGNEMESD